jgi:hypothetical protein
MVVVLEPELIVVAVALLDFVGLPNIENVVE